MKTRKIRLEKGSRYYFQIPNDIPMQQIERIAEKLRVAEKYDGWVILPSYIKIRKFCRNCKQEVK